ncbi:MAG: hypothetical protein ACOYOZ_07555 [Pirellula sp.]
MRLTLRTLLSYRDGVLPQKAHEELGLKFRESQTAQSLASRIDRSQTPPASLESELAQIEQTCSPNEVSEFLDGGMSLDRVFAMERKCIASDAMLAELATVHTILARELLGTSKNPSSEPTAAFLARLHALHEPVQVPVGYASQRDASNQDLGSRDPDRPSNGTNGSSTNAGNTSAAYSRYSEDAIGIDLEDRPPDMDMGTKGLLLQTLVLAIALAILGWWILSNTSVL